MSRLPIAVALAVLACVALAAQPDATTLVIRGARVLDVATGRTQPTAALVIEDGRITAIHIETAPLPSPASTLDGSGLTLVPGLFDLAVDAAPSAWIDPDYYYALGLAHGVTGYRLVDAPLGWAVDHRRRAATLDLLAPRLWIAGPGLELRLSADVEAAADVPPLDGRTRVAGLPGLEEEIGRHAAAKADWVHLGSSLDAEAVRAAAASARRHKLRVSAEPGRTSLLDLAKVGVDAIIGLGPITSGDNAAALGSSLDGMSSAQAQGLARDLAETKTTLVPMLRQSADAALGRSSPLIVRELEALPRRFRDDIQQRLERRDARAAQRAWRARRDLVRAFASSGGRLAVGTGSGALGWPVPGLAALHELQLLADAGVSVIETIRAATQHPAFALGAGERAGRIRVGAQADLLAVKGDPSRDIRALHEIVFVIRGGEPIDRDELTRQALRAASRIR